MAIAGNLLSENAESVETDASAWAGLQNSSGLTRAGGGTLGSNCLQFSSPATGLETHIGLVTRVAVTPGAEYWACASLWPPTTGVQTRMEIRWYNSGGTLISTSTGPVVTPPTVTWRQIAAIGTAPANAATANVVMRVTPTVNGQTWFSDRHFLGLTSTSRVSANLLPFNTESMEIDASAWSATGGTLGISTSSSGWYQSLLYTSSSAGLGQVQTVQATPVTPGTEYAAYAQVTPGTAGLAQEIRLVWLDGTGTTISTATASRTLATGQWTRCVVAGVAPPGAATARIVLAPTATAASQAWAYDRVVLAPTSALMVAGNLLPYNVSDIEQDASGWTVTGGTGTQTTEQVLGGAYALKLVTAGGDLVATATVPAGRVTSGLGYQFGPCVYKPTNRIYQTRIEWLNEAGDAIRTRWQSWIGNPGAWLVGRMGDLAPDGAVSARISFIVPDAPAGEVWYVDRTEFVQGGLTVKAEPAGAGGVALTVRGLTTGGPTYKWSLLRLIPGKSAAPVRGWTGDLISQSITGDIAVAADYEAPLGVPVQWRVALYDTSGVLRLSYTSDPVTLDAPATDVWLKDPGLPQRSVRVTVSTPMPTWQRPSRQSVSHVRGRRLPVVISDVRGGRTGDLTIVTETEADRRALWWVLDAGSTLLLQWPPGWGEEDMYVQVGDVQSAPVVDYAEFQDRAFVLPLTEVDRPIGGVTGSADRTWETVAGEGATWADVLAGRSTWLDVYTGA